MAVSEERIKRYFMKDRFGGLCGVELLEVRPGYARARMEVGERHYNSLSICQGGAIFTLADIAFAAASNAHGVVAVAIDTHITYIKAVSSGELVAEASEVSRNYKLGSYDVKISDEVGDVVANFHGLCYIKKDELVLD